MRTAACLLGAIALGLVAGCGDFLPLDEDPCTNVRISNFEPSPLAPMYDREFGVVIPSSLVYVENYSQVPVTFDRFDIRYYEAISDAEGRFPEFTDLRSTGMMVLYVPGVPTPQPYIPDSTGTRQTKVVAVGGLQILTAAAYEKASGGTLSLVDTSDDVPMFAVVKLTGLSESGLDAEVEAAVPITALVQKQ